MSGHLKPAGDVEQVGVLTRVADGKLFSLGFGSTRIGRQRRADLVITDKTVSRHHADIIYESGRYVLYDHSTNGTWVNGTLVAVAQPLRDRDAVKFGKAEFVFALKEMPSEEAVRGADATAPKRVPRSSTLIMREGKGRGRGARRLRQLVALLIVLLVAAAVVYFVFPDVAQQIIQRLPAPLRSLFGGP
jgi:predicted component of type VI protein secretion system